MWHNAGFDFKLLHRYHYYQFGTGADLLEGNYCRNPDFTTGIMPWCYTNADNCERNYCDPCQVGTLYDTAGSCNAAGCNGDLNGCAKTCNFNPDLPTIERAAERNSLESRKLDQATLPKTFNKKTILTFS